MMSFFNFILLQIPLISDAERSAINPTEGLGKMPDFIGGLFPTLVQVIAAIAILTIAYWGVRHMYSNVPGMEKVSKDRIWNAILGLLLALSAYFILNIINPNINQTLKCFVSGSNKPADCPK